MKEDLIETSSSLILKGGLYKILIQMYRCESIAYEKILTDKYKEVDSKGEFKPEFLSMESFFTLNSSSPLMDYRRKQSIMIKRVIQE
jgi:hypothetical protein